MNYQMFEEQVMRAVKERMPACEIVKQTFLKNNGIERAAIVLVAGQEKLELNPACYLDDFWNLYTNGRSFDEVLDEICEYLEQAKTDSRFPMQEFLSYEKMKGRIAFRLINTKENESLLKTIPNVPFLDLSIVFYCVLDLFSDGNATTTVTNEVMRLWKTTTEELMAVAAKNTPRILPCRVKDMDEVIREIFVQEMMAKYGDANCLREDAESVDLDELADEMMEEFEKQQNRLRMYVMTNEVRMNGASCILYQGFLNRLSKKLECDFIILPSSIHEVILLPERNGCVPEEYNDLVAEINQKAVEPGEVLSDHVYFYRRKDNCVSM